MRTSDLTRFDHPLNLLNRFTKDMERFFDSFGFTSTIGGPPLLKSAAWIPSVDIVEKEGLLDVRADLPGVAAKDVSVEVIGSTLRIKGERRTDVDETRDGIHRQERTHGSFYRAIPLPETIKPEDIKATFMNGVLEVKVPYVAAKALQPRRIDVLEPAPEKTKSAA